MVRRIGMPQHFDHPDHLAVMPLSNEDAIRPGHVGQHGREVSHYRVTLWNAVGASVESKVRLSVGQAQLHQ
ncbi:hypothetical protein GA0070214_103243 [Micromonospora chaiyaphumensis]|uniref:Uncharacterized protein n=1 Tax=Micromonospora chaiyaphumensis TaxID=307119 RepID=A0A1C4W694_9ACTN|nr:hypothetical protein GA0070214_103243 [Micromonospora chaiyaphumensis]